MTEFTEEGLEEARRRMDAMYEKVAEDLAEDLGGKPDDYTPSDDILEEELDSSPFK